MDASAVAFTFLAVLILGGALGVVTTRNVAHAALFLLLSLGSISGMFILLVAEFLALVQILIYGGAITIVLLFALMLTRAEEFSNVRDNPQWVVAAVAAKMIRARLAESRWKLSCGDITSAAVCISCGSTPMSCGRTPSESPDSRTQAIPVQATRTCSSPEEQPSRTRSRPLTPLCVRLVTRSERIAVTRIKTCNRTRPPTRAGEMAARISPCAASMTPMFTEGKLGPWLHAKEKRARYPRRLQAYAAGHPPRRVSRFTQPPVATREIAGRHESSFGCRSA